MCLVSLKKNKQKKASGVLEVYSRHLPVSEDRAERSGNDVIILLGKDLL